MDYYGAATKDIISNYHARTYNTINDDINIY